MFILPPSPITHPAHTHDKTTKQRYIAEAARAGKDLKIRASRHKFHTTTSLACPDQTFANGTDPPAGSGAPAGHAPNVMAVAILHDKMDKVLAVDPENFRMTVGAGMRINQLLPAATAANMSVMVRGGFGRLWLLLFCGWGRFLVAVALCGHLRSNIMQFYIITKNMCAFLPNLSPPSPKNQPKAGALPAYAGLTVGGVIASGAHGTGDMTVSTIADMIHEVTWVDGSGSIRRSPVPSAEFDALSAGLGLMGIITVRCFLVWVV
jgi:FAD/FMN-containing dehydrogenase